MEHDGYYSDRVYTAMTRYAGDLRYYYGYGGMSYVVAWRNEGTSQFYVPYEGLAEDKINDFAGFLNQQHILTIKDE